jgi:hypothetical protein
VCHARDSPQSSEAEDGHDPEWSEEGDHDDNQIEQV